MLTRPCPLKKGDRVALLAPASPMKIKALQKAVDSLNVLGLKPIVMQSCTLSHGYLSGTDDQRACDLNRAFRDPSVRGIFCLRGGYGSARLLPRLDFSMIRENPKVFVGYSDITALHLAFNQLCGFVTFHGPMPGAGYDDGDGFTLNSLRANLFSGNPVGAAANPPGQELEVIYPGKAEGIVTGGNLSLLASTLGSPYEVDTRDKILFIEEVGEQPYRIDRSLTALSLAGKFRDCAGIILGTFSACEEPPAGDNAHTAEGSLILRDVFHEIIKPWRKPTLLNFRAGHIYPQITVPLGAQVYFDTGRPEVLFQS